MTIEIINAKESPTALEWVRNVYPLYLHDLSDFDANVYTLNELGRWEPDLLSLWLSHEYGHIFQVISNHKRVGFAFIAQAPFPQITPGVNFRMSEFFILRAYRRMGIGTRAACTLFNRFSGTWEILELPLNNQALLFWRSVISAYTDGKFTQTTQNGLSRQLFQTLQKEQKPV